ncbi:MAG: 4'-phosphopantetheinyl transferase superfamily protein [Bacteroidetes bacterium]|nr:4'-phosphopantetheinyl transferase superfamily protein [Bacteroidota bacterium]
MPLTAHWKIDAGIIALWNITESQDELLEFAKLSEKEKQQLGIVQHPSKRLQSIASRALIKKQFSNFDPAPEILLDKNRKPYIANSNVNISISHTKNTAACIFHFNKQVGIDIEYCNRNIDDIKHKFLSEDELVSLEKTIDKNNFLYTSWCCKESLYKAFGGNGIGLREHISVSYSDSKLQTGTGEINFNNSRTLYDIFTRKIDNLIVSWAIEK